MTDNTSETRSSRTPRRLVRRERFLAGGVLLLGAALIAGWLLLPAALRLLPPRYVARLPEPLQALVARPQPGNVPTPAFTVAALQLTPLRPPATATVPPSPARTEAPEATARPTRASTGTATAIPETPTASPTAVQVATRRYVQCSVQVGRGRFADLTQATALLDSPTMQYICQTWNNCGPATLAMNLTFWGWSGNQAQVASVIRPDPEDKHTGAQEIAQYAESQGFGVLSRVGGTLERLRALVDAGIPVLFSRGFEEGTTEGWLGHYGLVIGYSEPLQEFILMDSLLGPDQAVTYQDFEEFWKHFNYRYIIIYPPDRRVDVEAIVGADVDDTTMYSGALARAQEQTLRAPNDPYGWHNLGVNLLALGDAANAAAAFDHARVAGLPPRMLWYQFGSYEAYLAVGRYDDIIALTDYVVQTTPYVEETYYYKGRALQALGDFAGARALYETALQHNPFFTAATEALATLPPP